MSDVTTMILDAIKTQMTKDLITTVAGNDPTKADIVKLGRFQEDPLKSNVYAAISSGDPERTEWSDGIVTLESMQNIGFSIDPREVGGGEVWWRRGVVQIGCYFIKDRFTEDNAIANANKFLHRAINSIKQTKVNGLTDSYSEKAVLLFVSSNNYSESGGPPNQYIWRGKIWWQVLTERP